MILKELDIIIKEENPENTEIIKILKSDDSNVKGVEDIVLTDEIINRLTEIKNKNDENGTYISNSNNYKITLENIDKMYLYNSKKTLDRIFDEINDVTRFMYAYIILLIAPIIILSQVLKESYIYYIFGFIIIFSFSVTVYNINNILQ